MKISQILTGGTEIPGRAINFGLLVMRAVAGLGLAFGHGLGKLPPSERFIGGVTEMGFPIPILFAWSAGLSELAGGILLALGLATRPSAFFILVTMTVAFLISHAGDPFGTREKAVLYATIAFLLFLTGAGKYSLDTVLRGRT